MGIIAGLTDNPGFNCGMIEIDWRITVGELKTTPGKSKRRLYSLKTAAVQGRNIEKRQITYKKQQHGRE
jgi:hypothetical protein